MRAEIILTSRLAEPSGTDLDVLVERVKDRRDYAGTTTCLPVALSVFANAG